ncbi:MAG: 16S rRNA (adenine(1518)-N(6)/adenine(1519)-N(6))-dimethyltransferase RsmA [Candidatus Parcubacteria bacterium]|nr:16S rRNA (adenine(1518)-N(6)/adenine(1519)-N(6))-dimethyltransferase RsmA [Candidatus Parcubacteria bacterium]
MSILSEIKATYAARRMKPLRRRGQNFLINPLIYQQIIKAAELNPDDIVLEIGSGLGHLSELLAQTVKRVLAVEIDKELVAILKDKFITQKNLVIIADDALKIEPKKLKIKKYKIVANLPYNITGAVLRKFLSENPQPETMTLMLQKEVARRLVAQPPEMSLLSNMVQFYGQPKIIASVSRHNFWPRPKVDSAIVQIKNIHHPENIDEDNFFHLLRAGFSSPRKYLTGNLTRNKIWSRDETIKFFDQLSINIKTRAENLNFNQWKDLYQFYGREH